MTIEFLRLSLDERKAYIDEAAARRGLSPVVLEKDFWVCWLLRLLFAASFRDALVFKGGTSLSKVFGVIGHRPVALAGCPRREGAQYRRCDEQGAGRQMDEGGRSRVHRYGPTCPDS